MKPTPAPAGVLRRLAAAALCAGLAFLCACGAPPPQSAAPSSSSADVSSASVAGSTEPDAVPEVLALLANTPLQRPVDEAFLRWGAQEFDAAFVETLRDALVQQGYSENLFFELFGHSLLVLWDLYTGAVGVTPNLHYHSPAGAPATLAFTGDINLADDWETILAMRSRGEAFTDCFSPALLQRMQQADILLVNNEFCFSDQGAPMPGKLYTFRAATENVQMLSDLGVDIVSLANNHVYDYGTDAFGDTLQTLQGAGIPYVGAGYNMAEAEMVQYFIAGGMKIAYVAASRAEKNILTPEAGEDSPGILRCYDPQRFIDAVAAARAHADVVIAYPHWGTENTTRLEDVQVELGRLLVEAGADAVIGAHPHVLQGMEFYQGSLIAYSLGNFWFNMNTLDTALLEVTITAPGQLSFAFQPCLQKGGKTTLLQEDAERRQLLDRIESISAGISISTDGVITAAA